MPSYKLVSLRGNGIVRCYTFAADDDNSAIRMALESDDCVHLDLTTRRRVVAVKRDGAWYMLASDGRSQVNSSVSARRLPWFSDPQRLAAE
jgi:hypothetical protein